MGLRVWWWYKKTVRPAHYNSYIYEQTIYSLWTGLILTEKRFIIIESMKMRKYTREKILKKGGSGQVRGWWY